MVSLTLPNTPEDAWRIALAVLQPNERNVEARAVVFDAVNELWRFIASITIHAVWLERLRRIDDSTVSDENHNFIAQAILRRVTACFRGSTSQPDGDTRIFILARVRSAVADEILHHIEVPQLRPLASQHLQSDNYLFFVVRVVEASDLECAAADWFYHLEIHT